MTRIIVHQHIKSEDMIKKEPTRTKMLPFINDRTNMYIIEMGGGFGFVHTSANFPETAWDGFIFDNTSLKVIDNMIKGLQHTKGLIRAKIKRDKAERSRRAKNPLPKLLFGKKARRGGEKGAR